VALDVLDRIDGEGAYANLALSAALDRSSLDDRDRRFVTDLVYGTTRMRRACDYLVDRFLARPPEGRARNALRLGAYQLAFASVPAHAAVSETVAASPRPVRGLVNAVLRKVAGAAVAWPDEATRLSVPDWVLDRLTSDLGRDAALAAVAAMNEPAAAVERADGYVQDPASQLVADAVAARAGDRVLDLCAAPGGKAGQLAALMEDRGELVCVERHPGRARALHATLDRFGASCARVVEADVLEFSEDGFDRILLDPPCSGLGVLAARPDARWRGSEAAADRMAENQRRMLEHAGTLLAPGGRLVYSVCTIRRAEGEGVLPGGRQTLPHRDRTDGFYVAATGA
jgi:16S rRNA (cytosine967-C5)-methyltransferase